MSAKLILLGEMEKAFLNVVNWMEVSYNPRPDYLLNPGTDGVYVVDIDFDHFGVTLMGKPDKTTAFRADLSVILEKIFANHPQWQQIQLS